MRDGSGRVATVLVIQDYCFDLAADGTLPEVPRDIGAPMTVRSLLEDWDRNVEWLDRLAVRIREAGPEDSRWSGARRELAEVETLPPLDPGRVFQSGANYRSHVIEMMVAHRIDAIEGLDDDELRRRSATIVDQRVSEGEPYVFLGLPSTICGPYDDVVLPSSSQQRDWELELAAVIGRRGRHVTKERALGYVAGYTICNDVSARDLTFRPDLPGIGTDWLRGKNWPTFLPTGPFLVPAAFVPDPHDLRLTLRLNGQVMQDETSADMMFGIDRLVEYVSSVAELEPGDLLLTGSPAGNGSEWKRFLAPGDVVEGEIFGLGCQRNRCVFDNSDREGRKD